MNTISKKDDNNFYKCPGAWVGNMPSTGDGKGNITVQATMALDAVAFLRRRYTVLGIRPSIMPDGLVIDIAAK